MKIHISIIFLLLMMSYRLANSQMIRNIEALKLTLWDINNQNKLLFGHQDDLAYGVRWWNEKGDSDVKRLTGQYPAVVGWDVGEQISNRNLDSVSFKTIRKGIRYAARRGMINTVSWHMLNLTTDGGSWDKTPTVKQLLPGGNKHETYLVLLDQFAKFCQSNKIWFRSIPIIFRPFHEHNGDWFWWGKTNCTEQEYKELWVFTYEYLINHKRLDNLLFAFSPDRSRIDLGDFKEDYLYGYPGDQYVDILGLDDYWDVGHTANLIPAEAQMKHLQQSIEYLKELGQEKQKLTALTETGNEKLIVDEWYTNRLLTPLQAAGLNGISYVMVWRNANVNHHYVPYSGHKEADDFIKFANDPTVLLSDDLRSLINQ